MRRNSKSRSSLTPTRQYIVNSPPFRDIPVNTEKLQKVKITEEGAFGLESLGTWEMSSKTHMLIYPHLEFMPEQMKRVDLLPFLPSLNRHGIEIPEFMESKESSSLLENGYQNAKYFIENSIQLFNPFSSKTRIHTADYDHNNTIHRSPSDKPTIIQNIVMLIPGLAFVDGIRDWTYKKTKLTILSYPLIKVEPIVSENAQTQKEKCSYICYLNLEMQKNIFYISEELFYVKKNLKEMILYPYTHFDKIISNWIIAICLFISSNLNYMSNWLDCSYLRLEKLFTGKFRTIKTVSDFPLYRYRDILTNFVLSIIAAMLNYIPFLWNILIFFTPKIPFKGSKNQDAFQIGFIPGSKKNTPLSFSFSGRESNPMYEIGAAKSIRAHVAISVLDNAYYLGSSTGSLVATALALNLSLDALYDNFENISCNFSMKRSLGSFGGLSKLMRIILHDWIPKDISDAQGRLFISVTEFPSFKSKRISRFESKEHLIQTILASLFVPFLYEKPIVLDGKTYISGNITDPMPIHDRYTITISSYRKEANISPSNSCSIYDFFGSNFSSTTFLSKAIQGYKDSNTFLRKLHDSEELPNYIFKNFK